MSEENAKDKAVSQDAEFLDNLVKDRVATQAITKLGREELPIRVYRHTSRVQAIEIELSEIDKRLTSSKLPEKDKKVLEDRKAQLDEDLKKQDAKIIEGVLTPLNYRDINDIKAAATEALVHFKEYKFDTPVVMARMVAEERYMTVFCALKKKESKSERYFKNLDEIALIDDETIFDIYDKWEKHFVLTDDELKNS